MSGSGTPPNGGGNGTMKRKNKRQAGNGNATAVKAAQAPAPRRAKRLLAGQTRALELLAKGESQQTVLDALIETIEELAPGALCSILLLDENGQSLRHAAAPSLPAAYRQAIEAVPIGPMVGSCGTAAHRKERVIVEDIAADPLWAPYRELALPHGLRACWSQPIISAAGRLLGTFAIYYQEARGPSRFELELIQTGAYLAGIVIERTRAETALRESEAKWRTWWENAPQLIHTINRDGRILFINHPTPGFTPEQVIGSTIYEYAAPEPAEMMRRQVRRVFEEGVRVSFEAPAAGPYGSEAWYMCSLSPIVHAGRVTAAILNSTDITERKRAEEALRQSEARLAALIENLPFNVWAYDLEGRHIIQNMASKRRWGDLLGKRLETTDVPPDMRAQWENANRRALAGEVVHEETEHPQDGEKRLYHTITAPIRHDGRITGIVGVNIDITERKRAEAAVSESEERFRRFAETVNDVFWMADLRPYRVAYVNSAFQKIWGRPAEELYNNSWLWVESIHPADQARVRAHFEQWISDDPDTTFSIDYRILRPDGQVRWIHDRGVRVLDAQGRPCRVAGVAEDVTQRKEAEEILKAERRMFIGGPTVTFKWKVQEGWPVEYVSPNVANVFGYSAADLMSGRIPYASIIYPDDLDRIAAEVSAYTAAGHATFEQEYRIVRADGRCIWLYDFTTVVRNAAGTVTHYQGYVLDITERKQAEEALRDSEERYRALANHSRVGIWHVTPEGHTLYANPALCEMLEVEGPEALRDVTYHAFFTSASLELMDQELRKRRAGVASAYEAELVGRRGGRRHVMVSGVPLWDAQGRLYSLMGTFTDITERKRTEEQLEATQALFSAALTQCPAGVVIADAPHVRIRLANAAAFGIRGQARLPLTEIEVQEHSKNWQTFYPDGVTPYPSEQLPLSRAVLEGVVSENVEAVIRNEDGEARWVSANAAPIRNRDGQIVAGIVIFSDITARKRAEADLRQARDALERRVRERTAELVRANEALTQEVTERKQAEERARQFLTELAHVSRLANLGELASGLAHELNQPLAAIVNYVQGCVRRMRGGIGKMDDWLAGLERAAAEATRAGEIIRRMRNFVRRQDYRRSSVDLNEVIREVLTFCEPEARQYGAALQLQLADSVPLVLADKIQLQQVVLNLVRNAFEAMANTADDRRALTIQTCVLSGPQVQVVVRDTGEGLSPDQLRRAFDPFFTTKPAGLGMGLPISQSIIEAHGGRLWAEANPAGGATFRFTLPASKEMAP